MSDPVAEDMDVLTNDPLFLRLRAIRQDVESGRAPPETVERWNELRATVRTIVESLTARMRSVPAHERDRAAREWIQAFADEHWPQATRH